MPLNSFSLQQPWRTDRVLRAARGKIVWSHGFSSTNRPWIFCTAVSVTGTTITIHTIQQTNTHFCSGIWSIINPGDSYQWLRRCGHRDWKMIVMLLNCNPEMLSGKCFRFIIYFIETGVICKLEIFKPGLRCPMNYEGSITLTCRWICRTFMQDIGISYGWFTLYVTFLFRRGKSWYSKIFSCVI